MSDLSPKQEAFAQAVAAGMNQSDAYRAAYDASRMKPSSINVNASKLMADAKVSQRVTSLRIPAVEAVRYGLKEAMDEAAEAMAFCRETRQSGAFVSAVQLRAKLCGLLIDKKEIRTSSLDKIPAEDLKALDDALTALGSAAGTASGSESRATH